MLQRFRLQHQQDYNIKNIRREEEKSQDIQEIKEMKNNLRKRTVTWEDI